MLIVLKDLHWADPWSPALIAYLAETIPGSRSPLVTCRPEEAAPGSALAELRSELLRSRVREAVDSGQLDPASGAWRGNRSIRLRQAVSDLVLARARRLGRKIARA